jgi:hypothetical protein
MNKRKSVIIAAVLLSCVIVGVVVAELLLTKSIPGSMVVKPAVSMDVYDVDGETPLEFIDYGQWEWYNTFRFPGHVEETPTEFYYVNNTDQVSFYVRFYVTDPSASVWTVRIKRGDQADFTALNLNQNPSGTSNIYQLPIESNLVNPDPATQYAIFYVSIYVANPDFDTYTPTLYVQAFDSASG